MRITSEKRLAMAEALERKFSGEKSFREWLLLNRKKLTWFIVVKGAYFFKRAFDIVVSLILLIAFSPLFLLIALSIHLETPGPIFYVAKRVGRWGREFSFPKFRTMKVGADQMRDSLQDQNVRKEKKAFKLIHDPRMTKVGKILRKSSLDEIPQLWTVLKGDMSLVGPRPPIPSEVLAYTLEERRRLDVLPGITGLWQVSGRADLSFEKQVGLDLQYMESQSFWLDLKILLKTIPAVLSGRGAY